MSGVKGKSGRKPRHEEESKILDGLYPVAVSVVEGILHDKKTASNTRLEAALAVIWKKTGKPHQSQDLRLTGKLIMFTGDEYELALKKVLLEDKKLIEQYGGKNGQDSKGEDEALP